MCAHLKHLEHKFVRLAPHESVVAQRQLLQCLQEGVCFSDSSQLLDLAHHLHSTTTYQSAPHRQTTPGFTALSLCAEHATHTPVRQAGTNLAASLTTKLAVSSCALRSPEHPAHNIVLLHG